ncbi:Crp/Fnr family transcriptional regulator [Cohnella thailandensis]|uniref:Crp/Fnr family transcriptional regulator n=1 Tax=Cohnella thailandensis TaxID=557557 RepID=A0A841T1C5_9BACL|nr:Crp/Fnr family transcriptional regulator [Cohnella thailandensis]MBB6636198.1 Crp/Fnr family transcriptional regulator [Cohnella thailandensis]MBP1973833.1 CRP/FNR family transcriptional regulator [Cohnella thailandensis]
MTVTSAKLRSTFPFFKDTPTELLDKISPNIVEKSFRKGSVIFLEGSTGEEIFFIASGTVIVSTLNNSKKVVLSILREGDYFGEMALVMPGLARSATVETLTPTKLYSLRKSAFELLYDQDRAILVHLLLSSMERLNRANQQIYDMTFLSVRARIIKRLLALYDQYSLGDSKSEGPIPMKITHQQLADMVGAVRETVSKIVQELCDDGLIAIRQKMVYIADPALLRRRLEKEA